MKNLIIRIVKYILGLFITTVGISFAIKSALGSPPVSAFPRTMEVICRLDGFDLGVWTMIFQSSLVLVQIILLRRKFELKNLLQVGVSVVFGSMTSFSQRLLEFVPATESLVLNLGMVLIGCVLIALGIALYVPANIVPMPSEGLIKTIAELTGKAFSDIKIVFDCTAVAVSATLCLIFLRSFGSIGVGTVILAIAVGLINKQILRLFGWMQKKRAVK